MCTSTHIDRSKEYFRASACRLVAAGEYLDLTQANRLSSCEYLGKNEMRDATDQAF